MAEKFVFSLVFARSEGVFKVKVYSCVEKNKSNLFLAANKVIVWPVSLGNNALNKNIMRVRQSAPIFHNGGELEIEDEKKLRDITYSIAASMKFNRIWVLVYLISIFLFTFPT